MIKVNISNPAVNHLKSKGIAIMLVVFAFNMVGDGLRDALDPRLRGMLWLGITRKNSGGVEDGSTTGNQRPTDSV